MTISAAAAGSLAPADLSAPGRGAACSRLVEIRQAQLNSENAYPEDEVSPVAVRATLSWEDNKWVGQIIEQQYNKEWVAGVYEHPMLCQIRNNFPIKWEQW
jgi:hypothetical protein